MSYITEANRLYQKLTEELVAVQAKRADDGMRYALDGQGKLRLERVPESIWERFCDFIDRLCYDREFPLLWKFKEIDLKVNAYLDCETDRARLEQFLLNTHSLNEIYLNAAHLQKKAGVKRLVMEPSKRAQELILTPPHRRHPDTYAARAHIHLAHEIEGSEVHFMLHNRDLNWDENLGAPKNKTGFLSLTHDFSDTTTISACAKQTQTIPAHQYHLTAEIDAVGGMTFKEQGLSEGPNITLKNTGSRYVVVRLKNSENEKDFMVYSLPPHQPREVDLDHYDTIETVVELDEESLPLCFKAGRYSCSVKSDGTLTTDACPKYRVETEATVSLDSRISIKNPSFEDAVIFPTLIGKKVSVELLETSIPPGFLGSLRQKALLASENAKAQAAIQKVTREKDAQIRLAFESFLGIRVMVPVLLHRQLSLV